MTNWYTAHTHFGHEAVIEHCRRPFHSAEHMDQGLIENLWSKIGPRDDLWIVGDFAFGPKAKDVRYLNTIFRQLPGVRKHLIIGNHDLAPTLSLPWDSISALAEVRDGSPAQSHTLCHFPMMTWNHARKGALQLFGHTHKAWRGSRNSVNVGVDVWDFLPVRFEDAARRARSLPINKHWQDVEHNAEATR